MPLHPDGVTADELVICLTDEDLLSTTDSPAEKCAEYLERIATLQSQGIKRVVVQLSTDSPLMYTQPDDVAAQEGLRVLDALFATLPKCNQVETFDGTGIQFTPEQTTSLVGVPHIKLSDGSIPSLPVGFEFRCIRTLDLREVEGDGAHALIEAATQTTTLEVLNVFGAYFTGANTTVLRAQRGNNQIRYMRITYSAVTREWFLPFLASLDLLEHFEFDMSLHNPKEMDAVEFMLPAGYLPKLVRYRGPLCSVRSVCEGRRIKRLHVEEVLEGVTADTHLRVLEGVSGLDTLEVDSIVKFDVAFISGVLERMPDLKSFSLKPSGCKAGMQRRSVSPVY